MRKKKVTTSEFINALRECLGLCPLPPGQKKTAPVCLRWASSLEHAGQSLYQYTDREKLD